MKGRVHVAGYGVITAIGNSVEDTVTSFKNESSGIGRISLFDSIYQDVLPVGEVKLSNDAIAEKFALDPRTTRTSLLGIHAAREAVLNSGINLQQWRCGLISATTVGGMDKTESFFENYLLNPNSGRLNKVVNHECGKTTELLAKYLGIHGFISTINTACSSSVNAIALGSRLIKHNHLDVVVAGGSDALSKFTLNGFNSLMILDKNPCKPFDAGRNGLNLGEGAGFVVIVSERVASHYGINSPCHVNGYANTNDAFHQTASSPEGRGSFSAMTSALKMAGLEPTDVDYINLHGTGTINNDISEGTAIKRLYGDHYPALSSTKAFTGHTLGASGGIEAVFSILAIRDNFVLPNLRFENAIPELGIIPQTKFESKKKVKHVMSNSFGFGGNCSSIIFSANT
ncbi:MAG: beta-ketoacyl-[acyl-carrier-protein] synthase family protein [Chryseolinea sp.]